MNRAINYFALAVLALPGMASAQFNVDIANPFVFGAVPSDAYGAASSQAGRWNYGYGSANQMRDLSGSLTPTIFGGVGSSVHLNIPGLVGDEKIMMESAGSVSASSTPTFLNLNPGAYDLYVYMWGSADVGSKTVTCSAFNGAVYVSGSVTYNTQWPGQQVEGTIYAKIRVDVLSGRQSLQMQWSWFGGQPADSTVVNGLQLVPVPAPAPGGAALLATAGLMSRRRNRRVPSMSRVPLPTKALRSR